MADANPEANSYDKANATLIQNYKKAGYILLIFKVRGIKPAFLSSKKPKGNVTLEKMTICERDGSFGLVSIHDEPIGHYDLFLDADELKGVPAWDVKGSEWKIKEDAIHFYLKKA